MSLARIVASTLSRAAAIAASNAACAHLDRRPSTDGPRPSTDGPLGRARPLGEGFFVSH